MVSNLAISVLNAALTAIVLLLVGALILWGLSFIPVTVPAMVVKLYIALIVVLCIGYIIMALLGTVPARPFWQ